MKTESLEQLEAALELWSKIKAQRKACQEGEDTLKNWDKKPYIYWDINPNNARELYQDHQNFRLRHLASLEISLAVSSVNISGLT